jgi:NAD(P)-dependent dehydrogenase (short-subunit alcohol dehydrogenase family)
VVPLDGRAAVVTGAGSGIGRAIALALNEAGAFVHMVDISADRLAEARAALSRPDRAHTATLDVSDGGAVTAFYRQASDGGRLDIAVHAAGVYDGYAGVDETSEALWRRLIDINLTGCFHCCKAAASLMRRSRYGRIINISSVAALRGSADGLAYTASKHGIVGLTQRLAVELGPDGITVNAICPGVIRTDLRRTSAEVLGEVAPDMQRGVGVSQEWMDRVIPLRRAGLPSEVADLAVFLASDRAAYITGQAIAIDGGWSAT